MKNKFKKEDVVVVRATKKGVVKKRRSDMIKQIDKVEGSKSLANKIEQES